MESASKILIRNFESRSVLCLFFNINLTFVWVRVITNVAMPLVDATNVSQSELDAIWKEMDRTGDFT